MAIYLLPALVAFCVSLLAPIALIPLLRRLSIVDVPNARSSHSRPTLRSGGLATLLGWVVGVIVTAVMFGPGRAETIVVGSIAAIMSLLGFVDDVKQLPALPRLMIQVLVAGLGAAAVVLVGGTTWWFFPLFLILQVGYVNTANFMDGINGISSLHGATVGIVFALAGIFAEIHWLVFIGAVISAVFLAFLPWNLRTSGFFLGDVGSYLLGGSIAISACMAVAMDVPLIVVVAPLAIYIADTLSTMLRRALHGEKVMSAHRAHAYQRLTDTGLSHLSVAGLTTLFTTLSASIGLVTWRLDLPIVIGWALIAAMCFFYLCIPYWRGSRGLSQKFPVTYGEIIPSVPANSSYDPGRWVVVGASGFVGSALVAALEVKDENVIGLAAPRLTSDPADLSSTSLAAEVDKHPMVEVLTDVIRPGDIVVNAAGVASPDSAVGHAMYGANSLLPVVLAAACIRGGAAWLIHLSSAAVQGRRKMLDDSAYAAPFSAYSHSKALGEAALLLVAEKTGSDLGIVVLRATSVQGAERPTTQRLVRLARSAVASFAAPGNQPTVVSSIDGLVSTIVSLGRTQSSIPGIVLQPWEGMSVRRVLEVAGAGKTPHMLPGWMCRSVLVAGYGLGRIVPKLAGLSRRLEMMWFGQQQAPGWDQLKDVQESFALAALLSKAGSL